MLQTSIANSIAALREVGAYGRVENLCLLEIYGVDAKRFLQSQTTNDVSKLEPFSSQSTCILDRKAHVHAFFDLYRRNDSFRIIADVAQIDSIIEHFEKYRFADKVEFIDVRNNGSFFTVQGPKALQCLSQGLHSSGQAETLTHSLCDTKLWGANCHIFKKTLTGEEGYLIRVAHADTEKIKDQFTNVCNQAGMIELTEDVLKTARIEAGLPVFRVDFSEENFLPETGLEDKVASYTKGCFLGQEVLARVKSQGAPTRALVGLTFSPNQNWTFPIDTKLTVNSVEVAWLKSNCYSPTLDTTIALAFVKRDYRVPDKQIDAEIAGQKYTVHVKLLPFIESKSTSERARELYERALRLYSKEVDEKAESEAIPLLRECLALDPKFEDAYEALGVILSKHGKLDEAIELMQRLALLNPDSVMAHTNLSVFYIDKGLKDEAEEEKAISLSIRMRLAAQQVNTAQKDEEEKKRRLQEATERMDMFKQVLEIDGEDLLANYGVGSCHVALENYDQGVPYLKKALEIKPSHTVAYVALAEAYEGLGQMEDAIATYDKGIEVASKRGDMSPMNDMQRKLSALKARLKNAQ